MICYICDKKKQLYPAFVKSLSTLTSVRLPKSIYINEELNPGRQLYTQSVYTKQRPGLSWSSTSIIIISKFSFFLYFTKAEFKRTTIPFQVEQKIFFLPTSHLSRNLINHKKMPQKKLCIFFYALSISDPNK